MKNQEGRFCTKCGAAGVGTALFCAECGSRMDTPSVPPAVAVQQPREKSHSPLKASSKKASFKKASFGMVAHSARTNNSNAKKVSLITLALVLVGLVLFFLAATQGKGGLSGVYEAHDFGNTYTPAFVFETNGTFTSKHAHGLNFDGSGWYAIHGNTLTCHYYPTLASFRNRHDLDPSWQLAISQDHRSLVAGSYHFNKQ